MEKSHLFTVLYFYHVFTIQTNFQMDQEEPGLVPEPCRDNQKRFLLSECDGNEPQRKNLEHLEKSYTIPHPTTTTTLLQGCLHFLLRVQLKNCLKREKTKISNQWLSTKDTKFCSDSTREHGDQGKSAPINKSHIIFCLGYFWQA